MEDMLLFIMSIIVNLIVVFILMKYYYPAEVMAGDVGVKGLVGPEGDKGPKGEKGPKWVPRSSVDAGSVVDTLKGCSSPSSGRKSFCNQARYYCGKHSDTS